MTPDVEPPDVELVETPETLGNTHAPPSVVTIS